VHLLYSYSEFLDYTGSFKKIWTI